MIFHLTSGVCRHFRYDVISAQPRSHADRAGLGPTLGPRPPKYPLGQACHVTHIRLSDWSKFQILCSDWLVRIQSQCSSNICPK